MSDIRILAHANVVVNVSAVTASGLETDNLTAAQFMDLYEYICETGTFAGFSAVPWEELGMCSVIHEPTDEPEGLRIYLWEKWPVAVLEYDVGYRLMPGMITNRWLQS
ncbi:hypothetical protein LQK91_21565 [Pantoea sp. MHSD4]|uniref:hypothetical protein n=1 Tax=Pantoea sp. MHSD4 TaxID=2898077 RepID=UPI000CF3D897|nr:hypothetical protein [Pantoea sp. MHSD4]MCD2358994.1 hypothetical protein [Pantoea sp. MHSD4]PQL26190.1 hypothetical protein C5L22_21805 [Pantoea ananatis]